MADFRILKLEIDSTYFFIRRETAGASTIGAGGGYKSEDVINHFKNQLENKIRNGQTPTKMDQIAGKAKVIKVTILETLTDCTLEEADKKKAEAIAECRRQFGERVINKR